MKIVAGMAALVTGAASGIGLGITKVLTDAGVKVIIADINYDGAKKAAAELSDAGATVHAIKLDVTDPEDWSVAMTEAETTFGKIQILCNNAGVAGVLDKPLQEVSDKAWGWARSINFDGVFYGIRAVVPHMKAHGLESYIVNTGSIASFTVWPNMADYTSTKMGVAGLSETLREELSSSNISVSLLCPSYARTSIAENAQKALASFGEGPAAKEEVKEPEEASGRKDDAELLNMGTDPVDVGRFVFKGIEADSPYIFTNPEDHGPLVRTRFDAVNKAIDWSAGAAKDILA